MSYQRVIKGQSFLSLEGLGNWLTQGFLGRDGLRNLEPVKFRNVSS